VTLDERDERQCHVRRAERAVHEAAGCETAGAPRKRLGELDVLAANQAIPRPPVCELTRPALAGHRPTRAGSTTADDATAEARPGSPSSAPSGASPFTRSAPRTYVRPSTRSSSGGQRVIKSQPAAVTAASSS